MRRAAANPDKFCHGYGIFQYDIQFFRTDPDYFLERRWAEFGQTLAKGIGELKDKLVAAKVGGKTSLSDMEMAQVAIAYNRGSFDPAKGLKQGYKDGSGRYYGENFADYLQRAKAIAAPAAAPAPRQRLRPRRLGGRRVHARPSSTQGGPLLLRSAAARDPANVIGQLGNGQKVQAVALAPTTASSRWTRGRRARGCAASRPRISSSPPELSARRRGRSRPPRAP